MFLNPLFHILNNKAFIKKPAINAGLRCYYGVAYYYTATLKSDIVLLTNLLTPTLDIPNSSESNWPVRG